MTWTQTDIELLETTIATKGFVRSIAFSDQSVQFASLDDMLRLLAYMRQSVNTAAGRSNTRLASTSKGT